MKGHAYPLAGEPLRIGRASFNEICADDPFVSGVHCSVDRRPDGQFQIQDLNSRNGTFVNGLPVGCHELRHSDEIRVGQCVFLFFEESQELPDEATGVRFDSSALQTRGMRELRSEDSILLNPKAGLALDQPRPLGARELTALLRIASALPGAGALAPLAERILEIVFEILPAARGAILLLDRDSPEPDWAFSLDREHTAHCDILVPKTYVRRAVEKGVAIVAYKHDVPGAGNGPFICAPVFARERPFGMLYLEASDPRILFDESHLRLASAVAILCGPAIAEAQRLEYLEQENQRLREEIRLEHGMVGESESMKSVYRFIERVAAVDSTVLIEGESGVGKELVARAIHRNSRRANLPFVAINCASLVEPLLESEMFGHEKGAFTGAMARKKGKLEIADGGTVFLDEVGEMPAAVQAKLLRAIQEREFERLGGERPTRVDVRWIAATNRDLRGAAERGSFRSDLYFRLNVVSITVPPLRERPLDIPLLAAHFLSKYSNQTGRPMAGLSTKARLCLLEYEWPGNVRELQNAMERAVVMGSSDLIRPEDLPEPLIEAAATLDLPDGSFHQLVRDFKRKVIRKAVDEAGGNYTRAAALLGMHPNSLHRLIRNLKLKSETGE
jgi:Nif-specific regulatory protein